MKILLIMISVFFSFSSCRTTKQGSDGNRVPTANAKHIQKVNKHGFWSAKGYVRIDSVKIQTVKNNYKPKNYKQ